MLSPLVYLVRNFQIVSNFNNQSQCRPLADVQCFIFPFQVMMKSQLQNLKPTFVKRAKMNNFLRLFCYSIEVYYTKSFSEIFVLLSVCIIFVIITYSRVTYCWRVADQCPSSTNSYVRMRNFFYRNCLTISQQLYGIRSPLSWLSNCSNHHHSQIATKSR